MQKPKETNQNEIVTPNGLQISVLASSSSGNVTYIETPQRKVLVDAGLSGKKIETLMNSIDRSLKDVDSIFVTHEHSDHCKGVGVLARRYGMDIYANEKTWQAMEHKIGKIETGQKHLFEMGKTLVLDDLDIESYGVSHDAAAPQFYQFHHDQKRFAILTDTGYVSERVIGTIQNADAYLLECNHDIDMLRMGGYPWSIKQRILSDVGHLSNEDGAQVLMDLLGHKTQQVYLGHLSQENNVKALAHLTVEEILKSHDIGVDEEFILSDTDFEKATELKKL
ncbi:MBL fold metallo-hydrolase [Ligilactobacillus ceti]|uniref:Beta-lactamase superfamily I metal-dependent hydrolase n=1 Tax=Ligilactobacillus ceti DSM 22408 TaxID=1122146 RepID=A0A0R2KIW5_9LACO|nr:MBL fold metallo-hydrolase [Ligilactobacillus ceti]KRN89131.1 beta-lactamase superfamily I metal-dependent hydrolase [Ligilactobacillus ceti DSM 22408]